MARRLRWAFVGLILVAAGFAAVLGADGTASSPAARIDHAVDARLVARFAGHLWVARGLADLGGPVPILLATSLLVIGLVRVGRPRAALLAAVAPPFAIAITELILKPLIDRASVGQAFPSGHATAFAAVASVVVVLVLDQRRPRTPVWLQSIVSGGALALVGCVSTGLVAAQYHFASDTLGGACVALVSVLTLGLVIDWVADRAALPGQPDA